MRYLNFERRLGPRFKVYGGLWTNMNLPTLGMLCEEPNTVIWLSYGNDGCDPVIAFELNLSDTRVGTLIGKLYWRLRDRRRRRRT